VPLMNRLAPLLLLGLLAVSGCQSAVLSTVLSTALPALQTSQETTQLIYAASQLPAYFNITITTFAYAEGDTDRIARIYTPIHEAEAHYLPVVLRNTLMESGHWGAVKVAPLTDASAEVQVSTTILTSTAQDLALQVRVTDSRGINWLDQTYSARASAADYAVDETVRGSPFQGLFNQIANDMYRARVALSSTEANTIVRASLLQYAVALAPQAFSGYIQRDEQGVMQVSGLPALDDLMYLRVKKIRAAEYRFTDVMDEQFGRFYLKLQQVYPFWQRYSYELLAYNEHIQTTGSVSSRPRSGSWAATENVYRTFKEYKMNEDELRELADSFKTEIHPTIAELEGKVIELSGPLEDQYRQWRALLQTLYIQERDIQERDIQSSPE